jgi:hypothetical protein
VGSRPSVGLERTARALRRAVDCACAALLVYRSSGVSVDSLLMLWLASCAAIPPARVLDRVRQHTVSSAVLLLLGLWLLSGVFQSGWPLATIPLRNLLRGLMFVGAALSNLVASRAYPEHEVTRGSLAWAMAAVAAGFVGIWLDVPPVAS